MDIVTALSNAASALEQAQGLVPTSDVESTSELTQAYALIEKAQEKYQGD